MRSKSSPKVNSALFFSSIIIHSLTPVPRLDANFVSLSEDMSPYCSAHDEWLIMKLCMHVGYHDANNVSNFGGDPVTQLNLTNDFIVLFTLFYGHGAQ